MLPTKYAKMANAKRILAIMSNVRMENVALMVTVQKILAPHKKTFANTAVFAQMANVLMILVMVSNVVTRQLVSLVLAKAKKTSISFLPVVVDVPLPLKDLPPQRVFYSPSFSSPFSSSVDAAAN